MKALSSSLLTLVVALWVVSCSRLIGLDDFGPRVGAAGAAGAGGMLDGGGAGGTGAAGTTDVGGAAGSSAGGVSGSESGGAGGAPNGGHGAGGVCEPDTKESCYTGPEGTLGTGVCSAGERTCELGLVWGVCIGDTPPSVETCAADALDEDCDSQECTVWARSWSGLEITRVAAFEGGASVISGKLTGAVGFAAGDYSTADGSGFVAGVGAEGSEAWFTPLPVEPTDLAVDPAGQPYVILRDTSGSIEQCDLRAFDASGKARWGKLLPITGVAIGATSGGVWLGLNRTRTVDLGDGEHGVSGLQDVAVLLTRADGSFGTMFHVQGWGFDRLGDLAAGEDYVYFVGRSWGRVVVLGEGEAVEPPAGGSVSFVGALPLAGAPFLAATFLGTASAYFDPLNAAAEGSGFVISGSFEGDVEQLDFDEALGSEPQAFVMRMHPSDTELVVDWQVPLGALGADGLRLADGPGVDPALVGAARSNSPFGDTGVSSGDALLTRLTSAGAHTWHRTVGQAPARATDVARLESGELYVVGTSASAWTLGTESIAAGSFLVKTGK